MAGFSSALGTEKLWFCFDYYGGDFGAYGFSLFYYVTKNIWFQPVYFYPVERNYKADASKFGVRKISLKDYNSPSLWIGLYYNFEF